ncbi:hypothetical protein MNB_SUP05-SYMBIONT-7-350 [hydrothermal vent metagenome]|uniref:Uncharacterized protein n=1 Tax=hydrothermal vent metagenome TaxID=652676 RepID=A0A1W1E692_9ZZZZ
MEDLDLVVDFAFGDDVGFSFFDAFEFFVNEFNFFNVDIEQVMSDVLGDGEDGFFAGDVFVHGGVVPLLG